MPAGALREPAAAEGRVLVGAARAGEPITDVRLAGAAPAAPGPSAAAVPVRLADPGVAGLLTPGSRVDVVGVASRDGAAGRAGAGRRGAGRAAGGGRPGRARDHARLILVTMPRELATRVAAASVADRARRYTPLT